MSSNLTDEIRNVEAEAARRVADAKAEAAALVTQARNDAAQQVKEAKQSQFRLYNERLAKVETEASEKASGLVAQGKEEVQEFLEAHKGAVKKAAQWLAEEVVSRYVHM